MEGERILSVLKSGKSWESLLKRVTSYLQPVHHETPSSLSKYELFTLKLLKQCTELLSGTHQPNKQQILLNISDQCCSAFQVCEGASKKVSALSYEKLLLHLAKACLMVKDLDRCLSSFQLLQSRLSSSLTCRTTDEAGLLKLAFELLWKAAIQLSKQGSTDECILEVRAQALRSLLSCGSCDMVSILEYVMKAEHSYTHSGATIPQSAPRLHTFHASLLPTSSLPSLLDPKSPCKNFTPVAHYLLHRVFLAAKTDTALEGEGLIDHTLAALKQHCRSCDSTHHLPVAIQAKVVKLWISISNSTAECLCSDGVSQLECVGSQLQCCVGKFLGSSSGLTPLVDTIKLTVSALKKAKEASSSPSVYFPPKAFVSLKAMVLGGVECSDLVLKTTPPSSGLQRKLYVGQLELLSFLCRILNDLLASSEEDIEVLRDSLQLVLASTEPDSSLKTILADTCLPILQRSCDIISKGAAVVPVTEYKWLGNDAYRLGHTLAEEGLPKLACQVLQLSCEQTVKWCHSDRDPLQRSLDCQLLQRFLFLANWYEESCNFTAAMATLGHALKALPSQQLESPTTVTLLTEKWVWLKRGVLRSELETEDLIGERLLLLLNESQLSEEVKVLYLERELEHYEVMRRPIHVAMVTVLRDLITLYNQLDDPLSWAHLLVKLAVMCRHCLPECDHLQDTPPVELVEKAVQLLEPLLTSSFDHTPGHRARVQQGLATAHLWKAIITVEEHMSECEELSPSGGVASAGQEVAGEAPAPSRDLVLERATAMCLAEDEEALMMSDDISQCLSYSVEAWQEVWLSIRSEVGPLDLEQLFRHPVEMLQHLMLTALVCSTHSQVQLALKSLSVLLNLCSIAHPQEVRTTITVLYSQALALFAELLAREGHVVTALAPALEACKCQQQQQQKGKEEVAASLQCCLALAQTYLSQGKLEKCEAELKSVAEHSLFSEQSSTVSLLLCARAKLLACEFLLHGKFDLQPSKSFLAEENDHLTCTDQRSPFQLSPTELAVDAVKLLMKLAERYSVQEVADEAGSGFHLSCNGLAWRILLLRLEALRTVGHLHCLHGLVEDAYHYAKEGVMLARTLCLQGWYQEFLLLLGEIYFQRVLFSPSAVLVSQVARLLRCSQFIECLAPVKTTPTSSSSSSPQSMVHDIVDAFELVCSDDDSGSQNESSCLDDSLNEDLVTSMSRVHISPDPRPPLCDHPDSCACQSCSNPLWFCQTVRLICLAGHSTLSSPEYGHVTDHVTNMENAFAAANDLLAKRIRNYRIDLQPVGIPNVIQPSASRSKVKGRGRQKRGAVKDDSCDVMRSVGLAGARGELVGVWARCLLAMKRHELARRILLEALDELGPGGADESSGYEQSIMLASLHHSVGVAFAQQLEAESGDKRVWFEMAQAQGRKSHLLEQCVEHFVMSYQLCFPATPTILLRETCLWLGLLLATPNHAHHFLSLSQHISLAHEAVLSLGKKLRKRNTVQSSKSIRDHALELKEALLGPTSLHTPTSSTSLLQARQLLLPPASPPTPHHTSSCLALFPPHWTLLTIALAPRPHPSSHAHILLSKATPPMETVATKTGGRGKQARKKVGKKVGSASHSTSSHGSVQVDKWCVEGLETILKELGRVLGEQKTCQSLKSGKKWWDARRNLNQELKDCLESLQENYLQGKQGMLSFCGPVLLILGRHLHQLPWESLPVLKDNVITRTPSLAFAAAHKIMVAYQDKDFLDVRSTYFVVNPRGDLKKTEKLFANRFFKERGWEGVAGEAPPTDQLSTALQERDLYVYCGHSVGHFLSNSTLHSLHCHAAALLMGCSSAELVVDGACDPSGHPLSYLLAGCPALVGCLWNVTDGEIDRFSEALIDSLLKDGELSLPEHVTACRKACRLQHLTGAAPVLYGLPLKSKLL